MRRQERVLELRELLLEKQKEENRIDARRTAFRAKQREEIEKNKEAVEAFHKRLREGTSARYMVDAAWALRP